MLRGITHPPHAQTVLNTTEIVVQVRKSQRENNTEMRPFSFSLILWALFFRAQLFLLHMWIIASGLVSAIDYDVKIIDTIY